MTFRLSKRKHAILNSQNCKPAGSQYHNNFPGFLKFQEGFPAGRTWVSGTYWNVSVFRGIKRTVSRAFPPTTMKNSPISLWKPTSHLHLFFLWV
jgi:hypothetical protein